MRRRAILTLATVLAMLGPLATLPGHAASTRFVQPLAAGSPTYSIIAIPGIPGSSVSYVRPIAINNKGQVTGTASLSQYRRDAFLFDPATGTRDLNVSTTGDSYGMAINDLGHVVGYGPSGAQESSAFIWDSVAGARQIVNKINTMGGTRVVASGINNSDHVVGWADTMPPTSISPYYVAFIWDQVAQMREFKALHCPPWDNTAPYGPTTAMAIDNNGEVVGTSECGGLVTAFHGSSSNGGAQRLPGLEKAPNCTAPVSGWCDRNARALAINNGLIVGDGLGGLYGQETRTVMWSGGVPADLGRVGSVNSVNRWGQAVGQIAYTNYASLFTGQAWINLNTLLPPNSGWRLDIATAINDAGQIIGQGNLGGFLMTPGPPTVQLVGLEVTQGVQDLNNSVPLVAHRDAIVRAYFQTDGAPVGFTARLLGRRIAGALTAVLPMKLAVTLGPNVDSRRRDFWSSLNFQVPLDWLGGTVEFQLGLFSAPVDCKLPPGPLVNLSTCTVTVRFEPGSTPQVKFIKVKYADAAGATYEPTDADVDEQELRLQSAFPVEAIDFTRGKTDFEPTAEALADTNLGHTFFIFELNSKLFDMRAKDDCKETCHRLYYGIVKGPPERGAAAQTVGGFVASGTLLDADPFGMNRYRVAHELGHELGLQHSVTLSLPSPVGRVAGYCKEEAKIGEPDFPYVISVNGVSDSGKAYALGPIPPNGNPSGPTAVYGLDQRLIWTSPVRSIAAPNQTFEMMSYCPGNNPNVGQLRWPSKQTYESLRQKINATFPLPVGRPLAQPAALLQNLLVLRGRVDLSTDAASFLPFGVLQSAVAPSAPPTGPYTLRLLNGAGMTLQDINFTPDNMHPDFPGGMTSLGSFLIMVPDPGSVAQVLLLHSGTQIAAKVRDAGAPTIQVVYPNGGETLSGPTTTLKWTASAPASRPLTYTVQYSRNGGATWETLVTDLTTTSYQVTTSELAGSATALIRVMATDGFNAVWALSSATFTVPASPPRASIVGPVNNQAFEADELIRFQAAARDKQDGALTGSALAWSSDRDGALGTGKVFEKTASQLSQGTHVITLKATNSAGQSATASVTISIKPPFYFAEGYTGSGFAETLSLLMPNQGGLATIDYYTASGTHIVRTAAMTAGKVTTVDVNADVGPNQQVSARVILPGPGVAERTMHFKYGTWYGSTDKVGVPAPAREWDFAEGSTLPVFSEFLTLQNPNPSQVTATLSYFTDTGLHPVKTVNLPASSRTTVEVFNGSTTDVTNCVANGSGANCGVGPGIGGVSARVTAASPIIAERSFYVNKFSFGAGPISDGHVAFGANAPAKVWNFAEGTTLAGFNEYLTLQNPNASPATVDLIYYTDTGGTPTKTLSVPANSRVTVEVFRGDLSNNPSCTAGANGNCGVGPGIGGVSVKVSSRDQPIVAERPLYMYFNFGAGPVAGAHVVVGSNNLGRLFGFAWASTLAGDNDYLTIQNPGQTPANLTVTYYLNSGPVSKTFSANAHARVTVEIFRGGLSNSSCSPPAGTCGIGPNVSPIGIVVSSDQPVLVEKLTYSSNSLTYGATGTLGYSPASF